MMGYRSHAMQHAQETSVIWQPCWLWPRLRASSWSQKPEQQGKRAQGSTRNARKHACGDTTNHQSPTPQEANNGQVQDVIMSAVICNSVVQVVHMSAIPSTEWKKRKIWEKKRGNKSKKMKVSSSWLTSRSIEQSRAKWWLFGWCCFPPFLGWAVLLSPSSSCVVFFPPSSSFGWCCLASSFFWCCCVSFPPSDGGAASPKHSRTFQQGTGKKALPPKRRREKSNTTPKKERVAPPRRRGERQHF